jgi:hypothetical protein
MEALQTAPRGKVASTLAKIGHLQQKSRQGGVSIRNSTTKNKSLLFFECAYTNHPNKMMLVMPNMQNQIDTNQTAYFHFQFHWKSYMN